MTAAGDNSLPPLGLIPLVWDSGIRGAFQFRVIMALLSDGADVEGEP